MRTLVFTDFLLLILLLAGVAFALGIYSWKRKQHFALFAQQEQAFEALVKSQDPPEPKAELMRRQFAIIRQHEHRHCMDFLVAQIVGKLCEIMSLVFSVGVYVNNSSETANYTFNQIYSLLAIVFIIITLYLTMSKRWVQYLNANRDVEKQIELVLAEKITVDEALAELHLIESSLTAVGD